MEALANGPESDHQEVRPDGGAVGLFCGNGEGGFGQLGQGEGYGDVREDRVQQCGESALLEVEGSAIQGVLGGSCS